MSQFQRVCLVHYHEIGLKGHNRKVFEMRLLRNIEAMLEGFPVATVMRISGRLCVSMLFGFRYAQKRGNWVRSHLP